MASKSHKDLVVWQKSMDLVEVCYSIIALLPPIERYNLVSQISRSSVSIPSNIAEGYKRHSRNEYIYFCGIAAGSAAELETQLLIIQRLYKDTVSVETALDTLTEVQKMLYALTRRLKATPYTLNPNP